MKKLSYILAVTSVLCICQSNAQSTNGSVRVVDASGHFSLSSDKVESITIESRNKKIEVSPVTNKTGWRPLYGSIAMPYWGNPNTPTCGNYGLAFDDNNQTGFMSHINDGFPQSQGLGNQYLVVDLGTEYPLAAIGVNLGNPTLGGWDVIPQSVDFYYCESNPAYHFSDTPVYTDGNGRSFTEWQLLNGQNIGDDNTLVPQYLTLARKLREHDKKMGWKKLGSITAPGQAAEYEHDYKVTVDGMPMVRFIKIEAKSFPYGVALANRTSINEILVDRVSAIDGVLVDYAPVPGYLVDNVSGDYYDYKAHTDENGYFLPERPYIHAYNRTMMMKFYMAHPNRATNTPVVYMTYEQALENIKKLDNITMGVKKIVYLVGWQAMGHDDRYPCLSIMNEGLKRPQDATAHDSFLWLQQEAKKYNTTVSVHITMNDAYTNSPLWNTYINNDLICKNADGSLVIWCPDYQGFPLHHVNYVNEWAAGYTQKRIDDVIDLLNLREAGTIHIDAFLPPESPWHGTTAEDNQRIMRKIFRYFRNKGVDVTSEFYHQATRTDYMLGLQPAAWVNDLPFEVRAERGASAALVAGGMSQNFAIHFDDAGFLLGESHGMESIFQTTADDDNRWTQVRDAFCTTTLQAQLLWDLKPQSYGLHVNGKSWVDYGWLRADFNDNTKLGTVKNTAENITYRDGNDMFFPVTWGNEYWGYGNYVLYSRNGYSSRTWNVPAGWTSAKLYEINENGRTFVRNLSISNHTITVSMQPKQMLLVCPQ